MLVDENRRTGTFLLLGSTEFSILQNIRESLTGRMGRIRLYPMNFSEIQGLDKKISKPTRSQLLKHFEAGGMPGIAFSRDTQVRSDLLQDWIDLTCQRDIFQFKRLRLDSELAYALLRNCATLEEPTGAALASATRANPKKVATHIKALIELFVLMPLQPHPSGTGKPIFLILDSGVAAHLGANLMRQFHISLTVERMSKNGYSGSKRNSYFYYRSTGKKLIHLVEEELGGQTRAFQIFDRESVKKTDLELLKAFQKKNPTSSPTLLAPISEGWKEAVVRVLPWEEIYTDISTNSSNQKEKMSGN